MTYQMQAAIFWGCSYRKLWYTKLYFSLGNVHHKMLIFSPVAVHFPLNRYILWPGQQSAAKTSTG